MRKFLAYAIFLVSLAVIYGSAALSFFMKEEYEITPAIILTSLIINIFIMVLPAMAFVYLMYGRIWRELYFKREGAGKSILYGAISALVFLLLFSLLVMATGYNEENPLAEEIGESMNFPLLILIPLLSSVTEETYFRGLIQMQIERKNAVAAIIISSLLFSLAHLEYGTMLQIIAPFLFGLVLGVLMHYCKNIAAPVTAHFLYNFISLATFLYH